jgi:hypothetical protein
MISSSFAMPMSSRIPYASKHFAGQAGILRFALELARRLRANHGLRL